MLRHAYYYKKNASLIYLALVGGSYADVGIPWPVGNVPINHYGKFWAVLILQIKV